jgi:hypothetical protein
MRSSLPVPPTLVDSILIDELSPPRPTTLLLNVNRPYLYNYWAFNDRLRLKNEKSTKRQQSSCRIAFYSSCVCILASVMCIVIYRFTDECSLVTNGKRFSIECLRHWLFLVAISISLLACSGVIFGACRYFRSQPHTFLYSNEHELHLRNNNDLLPITTTSRSSRYSMSITDDTSIIPIRPTQNHDEKYSHTSITNTLSRQKSPPFNYDELPPKLSPIINSKSPTINNHMFLLTSMSTSSSPQSMFSPTTSSNTDKSKPVSFREKARLSTPVCYTTCTSGTDVWEKRQRLSSFH